MRVIVHNNRLKRLFLRVALFAVLLATLAPSISRIGFEQTAVLPGQEEVCGGHHHHAAPPENAPPEPQASEHAQSGGSHFEHCPFCFTQACSFVLPVVDSAALTLIAVHDHYSSLRAIPAPYARFTGQAHRARAPPMFL
jgi:hypothetical protein